jgi:predicted PurR-regulated permease PerM
LRTDFFEISMINNDRLLVQILLLVLFGASLWVMAPFWSALFWGAVLAFASWPLMRLLTRWLNGRESLAAAILTLGWMLLVAVPLVWLGFNLADHVRDATAFIKDVQVDGLPEARLARQRALGRRAAGGNLEQHRSAGRGDDGVAQTLSGAGRKLAVGA